MPPILSEPKRWSRPRDPSKTRRSSDLTPEEQTNAKVALRVLRLRYGTTAKLAEALSVTFGTMTWTLSVRGKPSAGIALRAARLVGVPMEDFLSGAWPKAGSCPHCGRC